MCPFQEGWHRSSPKLVQGQPHLACQRLIMEGQNPYQGRSSLRQLGSPERFRRLDAHHLGGVMQSCFQISSHRRPAQQSRYLRSLRTDPRVWIA